MCIVPFGSQRGDHAVGRTAGCNRGKNAAFVLLDFRSYWIPTIEFGRFAPNLPTKMSTWHYCESFMMTSIAKYPQRQRSSQWMLPALFVAITLSFIQPSAGQVVGTDICMCSPPIFNIQLDLTRSCTLTDFPTNQALVSIFCETEGVDDTTTDLVPVTAVFVELVQFNPDLDAIDTISTTGNFENGHRFRIRTLADIAGATTREEMVRAMRIRTVARNAANELILNTIILLFTNRCDVYPAFSPGSALGWILFVSAFENLCGCGCARIITCLIR